VTIITFIFEP